jgi:hypothetical protein
MPKVRQTRHMWMLGTCYCLKLWLDIVSIILPASLLEKANVHQLILI